MLLSLIMYLRGIYKMVYGKGNAEKPFDENELVSLCKKGLERKNFKDKKILVIIPDTTRSGPTSLFFKTICDELLLVVKKLDFMIALGTHPFMNEEKVNSFLQITKKEKEDTLRNIGIFQHTWDVPEQLTEIGTISAREISEISGNLLKESITITINKKIFEYDELILMGPVFPHEVVGFSGGYKYLFPGISGPEFLHKFHWLGALITNPKVNGTKNTPVRDLINKATFFIKKPMTLMCYVVKKKQVYGFYLGDEEAWSLAADLSCNLNIKYVERSFHTVLSISPLMYEDIWTAGKCMYKLEPVVEDNGTLIIYAPHIKEVSYTHGQNIKKVGYHTRDYFLKQMEKFKDIPGAILAHSTHVKGIGTYDEHYGEKPRVNVVLATGISEEECNAINLGYMDYRKIKIEDYTGREDKGILVVENAGEILYRLESRKVPDIDKLNDTVK